MDFAVTHDGMDEGQGRWVLAVEGDRLLLAGADGGLYWKLATECKFLKAATPDQPRLVLPVQQQSQPQIVLPDVRRNGY